MSNIGWSAIISDLYPDYERTEIQGKLSSIGAIGRLIGVWIGGLAYDGLTRYYEGWGFDQGLLFFIASGTMLISTIPMFFVPEGGISTRHEQSKQTARPSDKVVGVISHSKIFFTFLIAMVFINFGRNSIALIKAQYLVLNEGFNVSSNLLGYIVNMQSIAIFIGGLFVVKLSKKFSDTALLMFGSIIAVIHLLGFVFAQDLIIIFITNFLGTLIAGPIVDLLLKSGASQIFAYKMSFLSAAILVLIGIFAFVLVDRKARKITKV
jgi:MFS family permease